jgi:hypothetical protein
MQQTACNPQALWYGKGMNGDNPSHGLMPRVSSKLGFAISKGVAPKRLYLGIRECRELQEIIGQGSLIPGVWTAIRNGEAVCCDVPVTMVCEDSHLEALCD